MNRSLYSKDSAVKFYGITEKDFDLLNIEPTDVEGQQFYLQYVLANRLIEGGVLLSKAAKALTTKDVKVDKDDVWWLIHNTNMIELGVCNGKMVVHPGYTENIDALRTRIASEKRRRVALPYLTQEIPHKALAERLKKLYPQFNWYTNVIKRLREDEGIDYEYDLSTATPIIGGTE